MRDPEETPWWEMIVLVVCVIMIVAAVYWSPWYLFFTGIGTLFN